ncbi:MAG: PEP-CTERM sorting domain-containing protein [Rubrivivax sp.]|nr:MAG: PEP-CTERM sorting domain-containing protein [Rubrivivax sp.]
MSKFAILPVALAAMLAQLPQLTHAQTVSGQAQISNFSVKLTDLSAFDLTSPSLKANTAATVINLNDRADLSGTAISSPDNRNSATQSISTLLDTTKLQDQVVLNSGLVQANKDGGNLSAQLTANAATFGNVPFGYYREAPMGAQLLSSAASFTEWTLTRNTDAVFTGTLLLRAGADATTLAGNPAGAMRVRTDSSAGLSLAAYRGNVEASDVFDGSTPFNLSEQISFSDVVVSSGASLGPNGTPLLERTFSIHVKNASSQALTLRLSSTLQVSSSVIPTTAVPESGTLVLMGLGLGFIAWRQRTRQS